MTGTARDAVDLARERGVKAGVLKLRFTRPFPAAKVREALKNAAAYAVVDRSVSFGWNAGPMFVETRAALGDERPCFSAIGGLGGADISMAHMAAVIERLDAIKGGSGPHGTLWLND